MFGAFLVLDNQAMSFRHLYPTPTQASAASVASPCVQICVIDATDGWCVGCARTLTEIAEWSGYSASERRAVMADLPRRRGDAASGTSHTR